MEERREERREKTRKKKKERGDGEGRELHVHVHVCSFFLCVVGGCGRGGRFIFPMCVCRWGLWFT